MAHAQHEEIDESLGNIWGAKLGHFADLYWPFLVITFGTAFIFGVPFKHWVW